MSDPNAVLRNGVWGEILGDQCSAVAVSLLIRSRQLFSCQLKFSGPGSMYEHSEPCINIEFSHFTFGRADRTATNGGWRRLRRRRQKWEHLVS